MTLVDLSHPINPGMPVYPGDPEVEFRTALRLPHDGVGVTALHHGTHTGTHLDAPAHIAPAGRTVDELELDLLHGPATILQLHTAGEAHQQLRANDVHQLPDQLPSIVCVATGWDQHFHQPLRLHHPHIEAAFAELQTGRWAPRIGVEAAGDTVTNACRAAPYTILILTSSNRTNDLAQCAGSTYESALRSSYRLLN